MTEPEEKVESEEVSEPEELEVEKAMKEMESKTPFIRKEDIKNFKKNALWFLTFYGETISEKTESESYPAFFLPSLVCLSLFFICLWIYLQKISDFLIARNMSGVSFKGLFCGFVLAIAALAFYLGSLIISAIFFKGNKNHEEAVITGAIFSIPLVVGMFIAWLLTSGAISIMVILIAFTAGVTGMYSVLPKTMLLKGKSRYITVIASTGVLFIGTGIVFRLLAVIFT